MPRPICVQCKLFYRPEKNDIRWEQGDRTRAACVSCGGAGGDCEECAGDGMVLVWGPYKIWAADLWKCGGCGSQLITGHGGSAIVTKPAADYEAYSKACAPMLRVEDC